MEFASSARLKSLINADKLPSRQPQNLCQIYANCIKLPTISGDVQWPFVFATTGAMQVCSLVRETLFPDFCFQKFRMRLRA